MNKHLISIKKLSGLVVTNNALIHNNELLAATLNAEMMRLGFIMSNSLFREISYCDSAIIKVLYNDIIPILKSLKGDNVKYKPMYPNFPKQVMEMDNFELYLNALTHYWTAGQWQPQSKILEREIALEDTKFQVLKLISEKEFSEILTTLLSVNSSLSTEDKEIIQWYLDNYSEYKLPAKIPFKENLCLITAEFLKRKKYIHQFVTNATDILRVMTYLSDGDVSLTKNTKFKSLPKSQRKTLALALEQVVNVDDLARHKNKWIKAFHNLHIGDYTKLCPKTFALASQLRNDEKLYTFNSRVERALELPTTKPVEFIQLLKSNAGEFARRLDHALRINANKYVQKDLISAFVESAPLVSTRVLCQLQAHFNARYLGEIGHRVVFPKGSMTKAVMVTKPLPPISQETVLLLLKKIKLILTERFSKLPALGKVWIDPSLVNCPVPMQQRSASTGLFQVARGTRFALSDKNTLRFFIYWKGQDIDLSATLHDHSFKMMERVAYTNLKSIKYQACHSGDITRAPDGAAEFIDITMDQAKKAGARYLAMNVNVFRGPTFAEHEVCYAGWMTREYPDKNEIFDPKTVEQKIDLRTESTKAIPVIFDLWNKEAIWCDLVLKEFSNSYTANNVENNRASIEQVIQAMVDMSDKPNLFNLFEMHAEARGQIVQTMEEADTVFGWNEIEGKKCWTPFQTDKISAEFLI